MTHDIEEAIKLGTKVVVLRDGLVMQTGNRDEIVFQKNGGFVDDFLGNKGFLSYLNITAIERYITPVTKENTLDVSGPCVRPTDPLIVGIRLCLEMGLSRICVRDENNGAVGVFELKSLSRAVARN